MSSATLAEPRPMTASGLWRLPSNGKRQELVKGVLLERAPAGGEHGQLAFDLSMELGNHVKGNDLGLVVAAETGFLLSREPDTVRAPDSAFIARERAPRRLPKGYVELVPDLVVEVVSPNDSAEDVREKVGEWLDAGVRLVWVVHPRTQSVVVHDSPRDATILRQGDVLTGGEVVPGFELPVADVFE